MTKPTAEEIREMAEWAGWRIDSVECMCASCSEGPGLPDKIDLWIWPGMDDGDALDYAPAWNDGRLLWAMETKLAEMWDIEWSGPEMTGDGWWLGCHGNPSPPNVTEDTRDEALWVACQGVVTR